MNLIDTKDVKWIGDTPEKVKQLSAKMEQSEPAPTEPLKGFAKMKAFIKNAVNCCIE